LEAEIGKALDCRNCFQKHCSISVFSNQNMRANTIPYNEEIVAAEIHCSNLLQIF
jgi:hypothetical protein